MGLALVMVVMLSAFFLTTSSVFSAGGSKENIEVVVQQGDTLWDIARDNSLGRDIRLVIWEMRKFNGLEDVNIQPGQVLVVPVS